VESHLLWLNRRNLVFFISGKTTSGFFTFDSEFLVTFAALHLVDLHFKHRGALLFLVSFFLSLVQLSQQFSFLILQLNDPGVFFLDLTSQMPTTLFFRFCFLSSQRCKLLARRVLEVLAFGLKPLELSF
jgi:hypothetical protein